MDDCHRLAQWLFENGGPAIRYRAATELMNDGANSDLDRLALDLTDCALVRKWVDRLTPPRAGDLFCLHGSNPDAFENVCAKLCELGIAPGMFPECDQGMLAYRRYLEQESAFTCRNIVASGLAWAGYGRDHAVQACLAKRLQEMYDLARSGEYNIYIDHDTFGDCPTVFRKRPLVNPEYNAKLPGIWDIYALAHYPKALMNAETARQIHSIIAYVLHPDYQALREGYGYMRAGPRRYYSMGWSVHLPGFEGFEFTRAIHAHTFVQRIELMAHFSAARQSPWFKQSMQHLESCRTEQGAYHFPARYLREQPRGYWVKGAYMRLEEQRSRQSLELDSTFRMCKIKKLCEEDAR